MRSLRDEAEWNGNGNARVRKLERKFPSQINSCHYWTEISKRTKTESDFLFSDSRNVIVK